MRLAHSDCFMCYYWDITCGRHSIGLTDSVWKVMGKRTTEIPSDFVPHVYF